MLGKWFQKSFNKVWIEWLMGVMGIGLVVGITVLGLKEGVHQDEAVFLTISKRMTRGELPYMDYFDHKPPIIYLVGMLVINDEVSPILAARMLVAGMNGLVTFIIIRLLSKELTQTRSVLVGVGYLLITTWYQGGYFLTEVFVAALGMMAYWWMSRGESSGWRFVGVGGLLGMATWFKPTALVFLPAFGWWILSRLGKFQFIRLLGGFLGVGWMIILVLMKLGVWSDFVDQVLIFNLVRYKPFTVMEIVEGTLILLLPLWWYWGLGILAGVKRIKEDTLTRVLVLMVVLTIPVILVRPYHHYWIQVIPMVTVLIYTSKRLINSRWWLMSLVAVYGFGGYMMYDKWQRIQALPRVEESKVLHCDNIEEILDYVVTDCKPAKFFYEVDGVSR